MRRMPEGMERAWRSGQFVGSQRAMARVTIVQPWLELHRHDEDMYATLLFGIRSYSGTPNYAQPVELPNVKSVEWDRTVESDAGEATLEFYNTYAHDLGDIPDTSDLYAPGYYTYNRGQTQYSSRWSHEENEWANLLMPDNMIRTFEGYGFDAAKPPERDPNLVQTGVWLIDDVEYTHEGTITVKARDLLRLLMDQLIFPPVNGFRAGFKTKDMPDGAYAYPVSFSSANSEPVVHSSPMNPQRLEASFDRSSNHPYTDTVFGHVGEDGVGLDLGSYWLSIGNARRDAPYAFEWIQVHVGNQRVREVSFRTKGTGYKAYLCIRDANGNWVGSRRVPYDPDHPASAPNGADTAYVMSMDVTSEGVHTFSIPDGGVPNAVDVRVTFGNLWHSGLGEYKYRAAVRTLSVYGGPTTQREETRFADKNYEDYCVDDQTEALTRRGWLTHEQIEVGDEVLAMDPSTGVASWQVVEDLYRRHRQRRMISMESQVHSSLTTPDHRWLVTDQAGQWRWRTTETLKTGHRIPTAVPVEGLAAEPKYDDSFVELVAWFWTEGWYGEHENVCIAQSEAVNPVHTARLRACLKGIGDPGRMRRGRGAMWNETRRSDGLVTFRLSKPVKDALLEVAPGKVPSPEFLASLTAAQLELFIERSIDADGWRTNGNRVGLSQRREDRAKAFEMACVLAGRPVRTRYRSDIDMWSVHLLRHAVTLPQSAQVEEVDYDGVVWCPVVQHGNWIARRNGTVYVTGNTDIVKLLCAWGGFFWPILSHHRTELHSDGEERVWNYDREDDAMTIARGRVFGDFELTGTAGVVDLPPDKFDKRTLMEGIKEIQDIVAFLFLADEHGGVIWRHPNIYELGNLVYGSGERTHEIPTIDERNTLISLTATLSSRNVRERVFVSDTTGQHAGMAAGFNPNRTGLRRIGGWTDQDFGSTEECRLMADMITLRQMFTYRTDSITIPGFPKIQVDDQVRIFERTTSEGFVHYVKGISSRNDLESGEWVYELSTHWLGERPFTRWTFSPEDFSDEAQRYMNGLMGGGPTGPSRDPGDWGGW